jgi:hypothetical protein
LELIYRLQNRCTKIYPFFLFFSGFVHPQNPPSGFDSPVPPTTSMYVPSTTPSHTPSHPGGFSPYNPPTTAATLDDGGMNLLPSFGNQNPSSTGNGGLSSEGTV